MSKSLLSLRASGSEFQVDGPAQVGLGVQGGLKKPKVRIGLVVWWYKADRGR